MDRVLGRVVDQSHCRISVGNTEITTDLVFADNAVIFVESLEVLVMDLTLEALHKEVKLLGLQVS